MTRRFERKKKYEKEISDETWFKFQIMLALLYFRKNYVGRFIHVFSNFIAWHTLLEIAFEKKILEYSNVYTKDDIQPVPSNTMIFDHLVYHSS